MKPGENKLGSTREALPYGYNHSKRSDLLAVFHRLLEYRWLFLGITVTLTSLSAIYAFKQPDVYRATAVLQINQEEDKLVNIEDVSEVKLSSLDVLKTITEKITHSAVLKKVVGTNSLVGSPYFKGIGSGPSATNSVVRRLKGMIKSNLRRGTRLIEVSADSLDPELAYLLANSTAAQYIRYNLDQNLDINRTGNVVLIEEAARLKVKLEISERAVQAYKETNNAVSLEDKQNITLEKLKSFNQSFSAAKSMRVQLEADLVQAADLNNQTADLLLLESIRQDPTVVSLMEQLVAQKSLVATYTNRYLPKYPKMIQAHEQLTNISDSLRTAVSSAAKSLKSTYENAVARERSLEVALKAAEKESLELNRLSIQYNVLTREMESDRALYDSVLTRMKETDLTKGLERNSIVLAEEADMPLGPYKPNRKLIIAASFVLSLLLGSVCAFGLSHLDNTVKTVDSAEELFGFPVLGAVPEDKGSREREHERLVVSESPNSTCTESYRSLRASVQMLGREEERRIILFTSALPSEGKTFTAVNYAMTLAQQGFRTVLFDFDLRKPAVGGTFGISSKEKGVTSYLVEAESLDRITLSGDDLGLENEVKNFSIVAAGPRVPNPAEQIGNADNVTSLFKEALEKYDRVVIDTAPINAVSDTVYLLDFADVICLVIRSGKTHVKAVERAIQVMERSGKRPSGIVLNFLPEHTGYGYYYYYSYNNYYGVKGVYGSKEEDGDESAGRLRSKSKKKS